MKFQAAIEIRGVNPYVHISAARASAVKDGWRKPLPVLMRINGEPETPWRTCMMPAGDGSFYLYLHGPSRKHSRTQVGDRVIVEIVCDSSYRGGPARLPKWFASALAKTPKAKKAWAVLTPSRKKEVVRYLSSLKSPETKARNLAKAMQALRGSETRFMGRTWKQGK